MSVNDKQVGGTHYTHQSYQHWDFAVDIAGNDFYLKGCASKYVVRYKDKNGIEDLRKALHYLEKIEDKGYSSESSINSDVDTMWVLDRFTSQLEPKIRSIVVNIYSNDIATAKAEIEELMNDCNRHE